MLINGIRWSRMAPLEPFPLPPLSDILEGQIIPNPKMVFLIEILTDHRMIFRLE